MNFCISSRLELKKAPERRPHGGLCFSESVSRRGDIQIFDVFEDQIQASVRGLAERNGGFFAKSDGELIKNERLRSKWTFRVLYIRRSDTSKTEVATSEKFPRNRSCSVSDPITIATQIRGPPKHVDAASFNKGSPKLCRRRLANLATSSVQMRVGPRTSLHTRAPVRK